MRTMKMKMTRNGISAASQGANYTENISKSSSAPIAKRT